MLVSSTIPSIVDLLCDILEKRSRNEQKIIKDYKYSINCMVENSSAIWHQAAHTSYQLSSLSYYQLSSLSYYQLSSLSYYQLSSLSYYQLSSLSYYQLSSLSYYQLSSLSYYQLSSLSYYQLSSLSYSTQAIPKSLSPEILFD